MFPLLLALDGSVTLLPDMEFEAFLCKEKHCLQTLH